MLGVLLAIGGTGYLLNSFANFLLPGLARRLFPWPLLPGFFAETVLCIWLLVRRNDAAVETDRSHMSS